MSAKQPVEIVCVAQVPPPYHGQAVMMETFLTGTYEAIRLRHVPLAFSRTMDEVGRLSLAKVFQLPLVVWGIWTTRVRYQARVLYYPPAGPNLVPILRDCVILLLTRPFFRTTVFHFHAGGVGDYLSQLPQPLRLLARLAYARPELAIRLSPRTPGDGAALGARAELIVPNGIADACPDGPPERPPLVGRSARLLYVGALRETKGVLVLVEAVRLLAARGIKVELNLVGAAISPAFADQLNTAITAAGLAAHVRLSGVLTGAAKHAAYAEADLFCFPTFYEAEAFSVVVIEAMQYGLPVVATHWRGLPDLVTDRVSGLLVAAQDPEAVAAAVAEILADPATLARMGAAARQAYLDHFTVGAYRAALEAALYAADRA